MLTTAQIQTSPGSPPRPKIAFFAVFRPTPLPRKAAVSLPGASGDLFHLLGDHTESEKKIPSKKYFFRDEKVFQKKCSEHFWNALFRTKAFRILSQPIVLRHDFFGAPERSEHSDPLEHCFRPTSVVRVTRKRGPFSPFLQRRGSSSYA